MTQEDRDALRKVAPALKRLADECLEECPVADPNKILDGAYDADKLAIISATTTGYLAFATLMFRKLSLSRKPKRIQHRGLALRDEDVPTEFTG